MQSYIEQYERVKRYLQKIQNQNRSQVEYKDDLNSFFQNCWHLKDWLKNDTRSKNIIGDIENEINDTCIFLMICADLANGTKHLKLRDQRIDGKFTKIDVTICPPPAMAYTGSKPSGFIELEGSVSYTYTVETNQGELNALDVANEAFKEWESYLRKYSLI